MIQDYSRDLLRSGIIELKAGNRDTARRYIDRALYMSGDHDVLAEGWYWMSQLTDDPAEKRRALENCLSHDLRHARARRELAILDGKLNPDEIINPDAPLPESTDTQNDAQRFMCPKCGGRMHYAPDGQSLVCEYCSRNQPVTQTSTPYAKRPEQKDFLLAMATARGHGKPLAEQVFRCQGCGAEFILPAAEISITCPYCESPHVVSFDKSPDLLAPDGIIPHEFDQEHASALLDEWIAKSGRPSLCPSYPPRALYLPLWLFEIGGAIDYTGEMVEPEDMGFGLRSPRIVHITDRYPVMSRLPIPASRKLSAPFIHLLPTFELNAVQPYDPRFLADWPAELYDIPMAEASLDARSEGFASLKRKMQAGLAPVRLLSASSAGLTIDSFELDLMPVWVSEIAESAGLAARALLLINGQTGNIYSDLAPRPTHSGRLPSWLSDLIGQ
ncbi:MAG: hypothetical protein ACM3MF_08560 [Anaerolineae bacterium]